MAMSYHSDESCTMLIPGTPALTSASVTKIDPAQGEVFVSWVKPRSLDTIPALGPYEYRIYRSRTPMGNDTTLLKVRYTANLADTTFTDTNVNTVQFPYYYKVQLFNNATGNRFMIGNNETASTMYPDLYPSDNQITVKFARNVPWINTQYIIYRQNLNTTVFDSIGYTDTEEYVDKGLANGQMFSYRVKAYGYRQLNKLVYNTLNWSHINSVAPLDTIKPCPPTLIVKSDCDSSINSLTWSNPMSCSNDIVKFNIYYKQSLEDNLTLLATINNDLSDTLHFRHTNLKAAAGCYAVTAVDSFNNESSQQINLTCIDICSGYKLPNVFTPNNDGINDVYISHNPNNYVKQVDMKIFNRWGKLIFKTSDPAINWDGKDMYTKQYVSSGVYYYLCDIFEPRLTGIVPRNLRDFIYVYYNVSDKSIVPDKPIVK
jgi:gliding motility-associated-like protein